jgi:predicted component of type VI protein secretion system
MAKALLGHLGGPDPVVLAEIARLRRRVRDLQDEVDRLRAANEALTALVAEDQMLSVTDREPALT